MYKHFFKRVFDFILALLGLIILSPLFLVVAVAIKIDDPGPVFFKQKRVGINKTYFNLYKFRSMKLNTPDIPTHLLENPDQYIIKIGKFIRKTSIDELPQLLNILSGERGIIETTKNNADFSRVVTVNSISL
jgi:O-antigen biosynthesis protein WbqP